MEFLRRLKQYALTNKIAQIYNEEMLTYSELDSKSDALACYFIEKYQDNHEKRPIVLYGHKENEMLIAMVACLKTGHAYIPIDITFPLERVNQIIEESNSQLLITFRELPIESKKELTVLKKYDIELIFENFKNSIISEENWVKPEDNCYILFTSGSTGKPKGVQINRKNIEAFTNWFGEYCNVQNENGFIMNQVSYSFDVSVMSVYIGLSSGKTLYVIDKDTISNFKALYKSLNESNIALWISTPSFAEICITDDSFNKKLMPSLEKMIFAGEVLTKNLVATLKERFQDVEIINGYGPTEATVLITAVEVTDDMLHSDLSIPIGYKIPSSEVKILDEDMKEVPKGDKGELVVLGDNVSIGYLNNEEMTRKNFIKENSVCGYKTGDLVYEKDNLIYYCGRKDFQIKLNGYRIEIEDVENNIKKVSNVQNAVVVPVYNGEKISHLTAFVVLKEKNELSNLKNGILIKNELKQLVPSYMVPRQIKFKESFSMNTNGKIDRKALMEEL